MKHRLATVAVLLSGQLGGCSGASAAREVVPGTGSPEHGAARATGDRLPPPPDPILAPAPPPASTATPPPGESLQACVDRELAQRGLNAFGDIAGTTYPHGTPVPAASIERYDLVLKRYPDLRTACEASTPFR